MLYTDTITKGYLAQVLKVFNTYLAEYDWVIAGGAARDVLFSTGPTQDVDVFALNISESEFDEFHQETAKVITKPVHGGVMKVQDLFPHIPASKDNQPNSRTYILPDRMPLQVVPVSAPDVDNLIKHFDLSVNRVWYDGGDDILTVPETQSDASNKIISLNRATDGSWHNENAVATMRRMLNLMGRWKWKINVTDFHAVQEAAHNQLRAQDGFELQDRSGVYGSDDDLPF